MTTLTRIYVGPAGNTQILIHGTKLASRQLPRPDPPTGAHAYTNHYVSGMLFVDEVATLGGHGPHHRVLLSFRYGVCTFSLGSSS